VVSATEADPHRLHRDLATAVVHFHESVARALGMTAAERKTLSVLAETGVTTPGHLAHATGLTTGAITGIVDRLEKQGFARRVPNPSDRRSVLIHALQVDRIAEIQGPIFASLTAAMDDLFSRYTETERALILTHVAATTEILREQTRKLKA
jgi:DNA-binding MarR family transcriptional regulator